jgi:hypothetical protein
MHINAKYKVAIFNLEKVMANVEVFRRTEYFTFDLEG